MNLRISSFPIDKNILLIDENHNSIEVVIGCKNGTEAFIKEVHGDIKNYENATFVAWCYLPN